MGRSSSSAFAITSIERSRDCPRFDGCGTRSERDPDPFDEIAWNPGALCVVIRAVRGPSKLPEAEGLSGFHVGMHEGHENELVARLRRREEAAFNELVRLYEDRIFRLVLRMIGDRAEAEDLAQEVFVTVFKSIGSFRGDSKLSTWMYRVATNHCRNRVKYLGRRARNRKQSYEDGMQRGESAGQALGTSAHIPGPEAEIEGKQMEKLVQAALLSLSSEHRELVVFRDVEGLSYEEIQRITALPEGTVKSKLHRARVALAHSLAVLQRGGHGGG